MGIILEQTQKERRDKHMAKKGGKKGGKGGKKGC